uniref:Tetraspanin n=1 Tax=Biomphalaria glabrata TaxID=6526 RepID=A0A2C9K2R5_BIOGL
MGCSESTRACLKFTIVFFNIPIIVIGAVSLGIGVWVTVDDNSFFDLTASILDLQVLGQDILRQGALVMIVAGAAMIILAGIGVIGALAMSSCILTFYAVVLILLLVLEVAVIILGIVFKSEWEAKSSMLVLGKLKTQYGYNDSDSRAPFTRTYDALQKKGCRKVIESKLRTYQWVVIGVTIAVLTFQFLIIVLTLSLVVHNVNNKYDMS